MVYPKEREPFTVSNRSGNVCLQIGWHDAFPSLQQQRSISLSVSLVWGKLVCVDGCMIRFLQISAKNCYPICLRYYNTLLKLKRDIKNKHGGKLLERTTLGYARLHMAKNILDLLMKVFRWEVVKLPSYSLKISPCVSYIFSPLKNH